jgi:hypothetical protein
MKGKNGPVFGFIYDSDLDLNKIEVYLYDQNGNIFLEGILFRKKSTPLDFTEYFKYNIKKYELVKEITRGKIGLEHMSKHIRREYKVQEEEYETDEAFNIDDFLKKQRKYFSKFRFGYIMKEREDTTWKARERCTVLLKDKVMREDISEEERNEIIAKLTKIGQEKFGLTEEDIKEALRLAPKVYVKKIRTF